MPRCQIRSTLHAEVRTASPANAGVNLLPQRHVRGRQGEAGRSPYRATKAALINFTECLAAELKEYGIDVNAICPGAVDTDMMSEITGGNVPSFAMPPDDIASVVVFLASDDSRAITGTAIDVFGAGNPIFRVKRYLAPQH